MVRATLHCSSAESFMSRIHLSLALAGAALLSGCANVPRESVVIDELITAHGGPAAKPEADADLVGARLREPITLATAVEIAFLRSPAIREKYAELGISRAE